MVDRHEKRTRHGKSALMCAGSWDGMAPGEEEAACTSPAFVEVEILSRAEAGSFKELPAVEVVEEEVMGVVCDGGGGGHMLVALADGSLKETGVGVWGAGGGGFRDGGRRLGMWFQTVGAGAGRHRWGGVVSMACGASHALVIPSASPCARDSSLAKVDGQRVYGVGTQRVYGWGTLERGELGFKFGFGAVSCLSCCVAHTRTRVRTHTHKRARTRAQRDTYTKLNTDTHIEHAKRKAARTNSKPNAGTPKKKTGTRDVGAASGTGDARRRDTHWHPLRPLSL